MADFQNIRKALQDFKETVSAEKKKLTPDFNLLSLISPNEMQLSGLLARLLDPTGPHEQGDVFLRSFIRSLSPVFFQKIKDSKANILLEHVADHNGRIDILIDFEGRFGVAVENKPFAADGERQIERYALWMSDRYGPDHFLIVYLSREGNSPSETSLSPRANESLGSQLKIFSYRDLRNWLQKTAGQIRTRPPRRIDMLLDEITAYFDMEFLHTNPIKAQMHNKAILNHILEAAEIHRLWEENRDEWEKIRTETLNRLFNETLPGLLWQELKARKVIDDHWTVDKGDFDITQNKAGGFGLRKKHWKNFRYMLLKNANSTKSKGPVMIFPAIGTRHKPEEILFPNPDYYEEYARATHSKPPRRNERFWSRPPLIWWADFPDPAFRHWDYEQWSEIRKGGRTVAYLADFFEKLISASQNDIDLAEQKAI